MNYCLYILAWKKIAEKNTINLNNGKEFDINGKKIAIFNQDGYHAMDAICVHQDSSIATGKLDGDIVECPSHFWHYNIKTGELQDYLKGVKLQTYPVEERNDGCLLYTSPSPRDPKTSRMPSSA